MTLSYEYTEEEALAFNTHFLHNSPVYKKQKLRMYLLVPGIMSLVFLLPGLKGGLELRDFFPSLLFCTIWFPYIALTYDKSVKRNTLKYLRIPNYARIYGPSQLTLTDESLNSTTPLGSAQFNWDSILSADLTQHHLIISICANQGITIPIDATGLSKAQAAREFIQQKISSPSTLSAKPSSI
ncbi:hypothetical protein Rhal01_02173 [Rubritalea halochordaticola]|uniref:YcxB family protein n=1 Tax=Rubritalea halochordaticola TaxID=714537 RepID=A0ABP9V3T6_9BACT